MSKIKLHPPSTYKRIVKLTNAFSISRVGFAKFQAPLLVRSEPDFEPRNVYKFTMLCYDLQATANLTEIVNILGN